MKDKTRYGNLDLARQLRAAGIDLFIEENDCPAQDASSHGLLIDQTGSSIQSTAFDYGAVTGYMIHVRISVDLPRFAISQFGLELPWKAKVLWLEAALEGASPAKTYRFAEPSGLELERNLVLNHRANSRLIRRGDTLEGYLLGVAGERIPKEFPDHATIPAFLIVYDQLSNPYRSPIALCADRPKKSSRRSRPRRAREPLFPHRSRSRKARMENELVEVKKHP